MKPLFTELEAIDPVTGEVFGKFTIKANGQTPHGRRQISRSLRNCGITEIDPTARLALNLPERWQLAPARPPLGALSGASYGALCDHPKNRRNRRRKTR